MAVQAEMGESASDASVKQVEVDGTAPISDVCTTIHLMFHSLIYSFIHFFIHPSVHSPFRSFIHKFIHPLTSLFKSQFIY